MNEPIAIVGLGCRFPGGADDPEAFWRLLEQGTDAIRPLARDQLERFYDARPATPGRMFTRWAGLLEDLQRFDAEFFAISPREAESVDPAQRLLLEATWEALEDAAIDPGRLRDESVGVYVGQWTSDFENRLFSETTVDLYSTTGSGRYASSGRLSYFFGFTGPSLTLDTACSSSLVAIHLACQSLRAGESSVAIAAGVNVLLEPHIWIAYSQSGMMAADGRCKFGDAQGDGYVRSEGVGVVVLKPLSRALADGDPIRALIQGSAVNNDGRGSAHFVTPSRIGQAAMLRRAYADAGVSPAKVGYIEAHGTGTRTGDPIELGALGDVLSAGRTADARCWVGSVKTNIGHTEGAAGMAGVLKSVLALQHRAVPASLHFNEPNPTIPWAQLPFDVPRALTPWPSSDQPRLAGVSGFGISGTNAHVVLQEAPAPVPPPLPARDLGIFPLLLSAASPAALSAMAGQFAELLAGDAGLSLFDVCATAARHRASLPRRAVFIARARDELIGKLRRFAGEELEACDASGYAAENRPRRVAFVFSGQGGQWLGMARELLSCEPEFRAAIARCDAAMPAERGWSVLEQLALDSTSPRYRLEEIAVLQPTLLAVEIALAEWWRAHGVEPEAVVGHSLGEVGAAHLAGALCLSDAMGVICARSSLMQRTSGSGAMALVGLSAQETEQRITSRSGRMSIAASNGARSTVVSGEPAAVHELLAELEREGVFCRAVQVDVASHSPQMEELVPDLVSALAELRSAAPALAVYSTVYARRLQPGELDAHYWGQNLRQPVQFMRAVERMLADGIDTFIEVGPHPTLLSSVAEIAAPNAPLTLASLRRGEPERAVLVTSLGALWAAGHPVSWSALFPTGAYARTSLPHYPWRRVRHWSKAARPAPERAAFERSTTLAENLEGCVYTAVWESCGRPSVPGALRHWLLVAPDGGAGEALADALARLGAQAERVATIDEAALWIDRASQAILKDLAIVLYVAEADPTPAWHAVAAFSRLERAWASRPASPPPRLWFVTSRAETHPGDTAENVNVDHASVWGAARVIASENPSWWGGICDLGAPRSSAEARTLAEQLMSGSGEDQLSIRGGESYRLRLARAELEASDSGPFHFRSDAAYLITGGLGGVALEIAKEIVAQGARRIILLGRSALPERSSFAREPATTSAGRRIAAVRALERAGAAVHVIHADASDPLALRASLKEYEEQGYPEIRGVIHCAAVTDNKLIGDLTAADFERVLGPKLGGARTLDELFPSLDLFVMFSSMSAFWGPSGMANYAAANAGLDAVARARRARGQHALSVQWGYWANTGLAAGDSAQRNFQELERVGVGALSISEATSLFTRLIAQSEPVVAALPVDWTKFRREQRGRDWPLFRDLAAGELREASADGARGFAERMRAASPAERRALLDGIVRDAIGSVLRRSGKQFDARQSFGSAGLDSLMALEFRNRLETATERALPATLAWNYPTIEQLVGYLDAQFTPVGETATLPNEAGSSGMPVDTGALFEDIAALSDADAARALRGGH